MPELTPEGRKTLEEIAGRHSVSLDAVLTLLGALAAGGGTQAQFNHPDLGGMGQWSRGGMIMVGNMFNHGLKSRVDALATELAGLLGNQALFAATNQSQSQTSGNAQWQGSGSGMSLFVQGSSSSSQWWPKNLGAPTSTGAQNGLRYAWFSHMRRLAIQVGSETKVYDTGDHAIYGFSQQQGGDQSITLNSQFGVVRVDDLLLVSEQDSVETPSPTAAAELKTEPPPHSNGSVGCADMQRTPASPPLKAHGLPVADAVFAAIEGLFALHQKGVLSDEEFTTKKQDLLNRL